MTIATEILLNELLLVLCIGIIFLFIFYCADWSTVNGCKGPNGEDYHGLNGDILGRVLLVVCRELIGHMIGSLTVTHLHVISPLVIG